MLIKECTRMHFKYSRFLGCRHSLVAITHSVRHWRRPTNPDMVDACLRPREIPLYERPSVGNLGDIHVCNRRQAHPDCEALLRVSYQNQVHSTAVLDEKRSQSHGTLGC
jgi:hypothetical protein